jgi:5-methylcytosine-specific restriction endonuclease McrA
MSSAEYRAAYRAAHKEEIAKSGAEYRAAHKEEIAKRDAEYKASHKEYIAQRNAEYYAAHREDATKRSAEYYAEHKEERVKRSAEYYAAHKEEITRYYAKYRAEHKERMAKYRSEYWAAHREEYAEYRSSRPELNRFYKLRRRSRKINAPGNDYITPELLEARWDYYGRNCYLCGATATATDHIKPLAKGGSQYPANLRPICKRCNCIKNDKWPYDFEAHRARVQAERESLVIAD